jgi:hypothetical protein
MSITQNDIIDAQVAFHEDRTDGLVIEKSLYVPDNFISELKNAKVESTGKREGEFQHVAAIPDFVHEMWMQRDNYDCTKEDIRSTVKKLHAEGLDAFIVTNKRV